MDFVYEAVFCSNFLKGPVFTSSFLKADVREATERGQRQPSGEHFPCGLPVTLSSVIQDQTPARKTVLSVGMGTELHTGLVK